MSSQPKTLLTEAEYLEIERRAERKSEYYQGEMFAMAGASPRHAGIVTNLVGQLWQQLKGRPCQAYSNDLRLRVTPTGLFTYPDVMVVCGGPQFAENDRNTLLNPTIIIEVLSPSTREHDKGWKFDHYRRLPSLTDYLTVEQSAPRIHRATRQPGDNWHFSDYDGLEQTIELTSIGCTLPMAEVYDKIEWSAPSASLI